MSVIAATGLAASILLTGCAAGGGGTYVPPPRSLAPTPTPPPRAEEAGAALRAFAALVARDDLTFRVEERLSSTAGDAAAVITMDVAGADFSATIEEKGQRAMELRSVGGRTFARVGDGRWRQGDPNELVIDELVDPWLHLCWLNDLEYAGPADQPADAFAYGCDVPYTYQSPVMQVLGQTGRIQAFDLVLAADGAPVRMHVAGDGRTVASEAGAFISDYEFSRVGDAIEVKVPRR